MLKIRQLLQISLTALVLASAGLAQPANAADFVSQRGIPDQVLVDNIDRLVNYVLTGEIKPAKKAAVITRLLGKEDLGNSKARIWYCVRPTQDEKAAQECRDTIRLIRLDTGLWVLEDEKSGTWIIATQ